MVFPLTHNFERGGGVALNIFTWGLSILNLLSVDEFIGYRWERRWGFCVFHFLPDLFLRLKIGDGGRVRSLGRLLSLWVSSSYPFLLSLWVGCGGGFNPSDN